MASEVKPMANIIRRKEQQAWDPFRMMRELMQWEPFRGEQLAVPYGGYEQTFVPTFDVKETKEGYFFKADLPGIKEQDLDVSLHANRLTISGKREAEQREENETWYSYERSYGSFQRSFTLPDGIDPEHVRAELKDGVLNLFLAKKPEVQPKKINVVGGAAEKKLKA
jgi:HSP20 family protein